MAATDFNDPYWLAIAAAAPVIGLAAAVAGEQTARRVDRHRDEAASRGSPKPPFPVVFYLHYANIIAQACALFGAVSSLGYGKDYIPKLVATWLVVLGLVAVFVPSIVLALYPDPRFKQPPLL